MPNPSLLTLLIVSVLATFSSILLYPTSYALAQNGTDDSTTSEEIERTDDTATMVRRVPDDTTPPVITVPQSMVFEAPSEDDAQVRYYVTAQDDFDGRATLGKDGSHVQDNVGGDITISCHPASGSMFPIGDTEVECSAEDKAGNRETESFIITLFFPDRIPPDITVPSDITEEATGPDGAQVSFEEPTAVDDVDGAVDVDCNRNSNEIFPIDETVITCNAEDEARNPAEESFIIMVVDTTPPDITVPSDITEEATGPDGAQVSFGVSAEDIVDGPVDVICNHNPSERFPVGDNIVLCRATDTAGNPAEESFIIMVVDTPGGGGGQVPEGGGGGQVPEGGGGGQVPEGGTILRPDFLVGGSDGRTILPPGTGWLTPLVALASIVIGGIALGKYKASRGHNRRLEIPPSALVEVRSKGGISR